MSYKKTTIAEASNFLEQACAILETIPGLEKLESRKRTPLVCAAQNYALNTRYGRLEIHVYDDWIPTRFTDTDRRGELPSSIGKWPVNQYSGKWNFHYSRGYDLTAWLESVWREIEDVTHAI